MCSHGVVVFQGYPVRCGVVDNAADVSTPLFYPATLYTAHFSLVLKITALSYHRIFRVILDRLRFARTQGGSCLRRVLPRHFAVRCFVG